MQSLLKNIKLENELLKKSTVLKIILFQITHLYRGFLQTACQHAVAVRTVSLCSVKQLCCVISKRSLQSCHVIKLYTDFKSHSYKSLHLQLQLLSLSTTTTTSTTGWFQNIFFYFPVGRQVECSSSSHAFSVLHPVELLTSHTIQPFALHRVKS